MAASSASSAAGCDMHRMSLAVIDAKRVTVDAELAHDWAGCGARAHGPDSEAALEPSWKVSDLRCAVLSLHCRAGAGRAIVVVRCALFFKRSCMCGGWALGGHAAVHDYAVVTGNLLRAFP